MQNKVTVPDPAPKITKGQCLSCQHCITKDDGYERRLVCVQTKRGKTLTWTMHTGRFGKDGEFVHDSIETLDKKMKNSIANRIPPKSCIFRKDRK